MDFVRLGEVYTTLYVPDMLIEGYNSLIWTERAQTHGEFELKTYNIGLQDILPEDCLVSHLETKEVMQVETHSIEMVGEGADQIPELTIRGRSVTNVLENRWVESSYQKKRHFRKKYSATSALCVLLWQAVDNNSGKDVTRGDATPDEDHTLSDYDYSWTTLDDIPNVQVTETVPTEGATRWWNLEEGILWPQFQKIMVDQDLNIRTIRPTPPNPGKVVTVATALASRGTITRTDVADIGGLRFDIYKGVDRSATVQFSQLQGHMDKPQYLRSTQGHKSVVEIRSGEVTVSDVYRDGEAGFVGWKRRVTELDAGSPEIPDAPNKPDDLGRNPTAAERNNYHDAMDTWRAKMGRWRNKRDTIVDRFKTEAREDAKRVLKEQRRTNMFAGDISDLSPWKYKTHYDLGDTVMLVGDYGKSAKMIVAEYVRTEDINGDRGIPGLVAP